MHGLSNWPTMSNPRPFVFSTFTWRAREDIKRVIIWVFWLVIVIRGQKGAKWVVLSCLKAQFEPLYIYKQHCLVAHQPTLATENGKDEENAPLMLMMLMIPMLMMMMKHSKARWWMPLSVAAAKKPPNNWAIAHLPLFSIVQNHWWWWWSWFFIIIYTDDHL